MKRFFYTTAAVVAFAFSGMANTIELDFEASNQIDCDKVAREVWWAWWGNGASAETADRKSQEAKKECEDENAKTTPNSPKINTPRLER